MACSAAAQEVPRGGTWRAYLESPGGELPFEFRIVARNSVTWGGWLINGTEEIEIPSVKWNGNAFRFDIDYYDSVITATLEANGSQMRGHWERRGAEGKTTRMTFRAKLGRARRFPRIEEQSALPIERSVDGRWSVRFSSSDDPAERHQGLKLFVNDFRNRPAIQVDKLLVKSLVAVKLALVILIFKYPVCIQQ